MIEGDRDWLPSAPLDIEYDDHDIEGYSPQHNSINITNIINISINMNKYISL